MAFSRAMRSPRASAYANWHLGRCYSKRGDVAHTIKIQSPKPTLGIYTAPHLASSSETPENWHFMCLSNGGINAENYAYKNYMIFIYWKRFAGRDSIYVSKCIICGICDVSGESESLFLLLEAQWFYRCTIFFFFLFHIRCVKRELSVRIFRVCMWAIFKWIYWHGKF